MREPLCMQDPDGALLLKISDWPHWDAPTPEVDHPQGELQLLHRVSNPLLAALSMSWNFVPFTIPAMPFRITSGVQQFAYSLTIPSQCNMWTSREKHTPTCCVRRQYNSGTSASRKTSSPEDHLSGVQNHLVDHFSRNLSQPSVLRSTFAELSICLPLETTENAICYYIEWVSVQVLWLMLSTSVGIQHSCMPSTQSQLFHWSFSSWGRIMPSLFSLCQHCRDNVGSTTSSVCWFVFSYLFIFILTSWLSTTAGFCMQHSTLCISWHGCCMARWWGGTTSNKCSLIV